MDNSLSGRRRLARQTSEKDVLCLHPVLCTRQMACRTSFLSRQRDVIASFSFGAWLVHRNFLQPDIILFFHQPFCLEAL